jgi:photosystem II stability/assembly factor-like uncharacterized protein
VKNLFLTFAALCGLFTIINPASAQLWKQNTITNEVWTAVASSADGTRLVACARTAGPVFVSTNSGLTWTPTSLIARTRAAGPQLSGGHLIASSADGSVLVVLDDHTFVQISRDSGATWTTRAPGTFHVTGIASSADGSKLAVTESSGQILTSTDFGTNWTTRATTQQWEDIASSADGSKLVAVTYYGDSLEDIGGQIYTSTDSGTNWVARGTSQYWQSVASSADGTRLVAVNQRDSNFPAFPFTGAIYTSSDSGTNWTGPPLDTCRILDWASVASSTNGQRLVAVAGDSLSGCSTPIYTSTNAGATWQLAYAPERNWETVASSADGSKLIAAGELLSDLTSSVIYTYADLPTNAPTLNMATAGGSAFLSWPWPSAGFVLQQNSDLATTNWVNLPGAPAVVNQMITPQTSSNKFFRLTHP